MFLDFFFFLRCPRKLPAGGTFFLNVGSISSNYKSEFYNHILGTVTFHDNFIQIYKKKS